MSNQPSDHLRQLRELLGAEYRAPQTLRQMAGMVGYSPFHLQRLFSQTYGESPAEFLTRLRMAEAKRLLLRSSLSVAEIALEIGYSSPTTFSRCFSERTGQAPSDFKKSFHIGSLSTLKLIPACFIRS